LAPGTRNFSANSLAHFPDRADHAQADGSLSDQPFTYTLGWNGFKKFLAQVRVTRVKHPEQSGLLNFFLFGNAFFVLHFYAEIKIFY
jgi:hypothetical protein